MNAEEQQPAIEPVTIEAEAGSDVSADQSPHAESGADQPSVDGDASEVQASDDSSDEHDAVEPDQAVVAEDAAAEVEAGQTDGGADTVAETNADADLDAITLEGESSDATEATDLAHPDESALVPVEPPPVPQPVHVIALNEKYPAAAGHRAFWREAGYECRAVIQNANVTVSCKRMDDTEPATEASQPASESQAVESSQPPQPTQSPRSQAQEILLRRRFVSQGEAVAFMESCLAFDPNNAAELGFDEVGRII